MNENSELEVLRQLHNTVMKRGCLCTTDTEHPCVCGWDEAFKIWMKQHV